MPYVARDGGNIVGRYSVLQPGIAEELLADNDPEILSLELGEIRAQKEAAFVVAGVIRIAAQVPDWDTVEQIKTVAGLWASHLVAGATAEQRKSMRIYRYLRDTVPARLNAVTTRTALDDIDPRATNPFGLDAPWPS